MKSKKIISSIVITCILSLSLVQPVAARTEAEKQEAKEKQEEIMRVAIGLVAIVGIFYMLGEMDDDNNLAELSLSKEITLYKKHPVKFRFGLPSSNGSIRAYRSTQNDLQNESFDQNQILEMKISW